MNGREQHLTLLTEIWQGKNERGKITLSSYNVEEDGTSWILEPRTWLKLQALVWGVAGAGGEQGRVEFKI